MIVGHTVASSAGMLLAVDDNVCLMMNRPRDVLVGMSYAALTHPGDVTFSDAKVNQLRNGLGSLSFSKRYVRPDNSTVAVDLHVSVVHDGIEGGRLIGTLMSAGEIDPPAPRDLWARTRELLRLDERRGAMLGEGLSGDHGWTLLLHIYLAEAEGREIDGARLSGISGVRAELAGRWLKALLGRGLIERDARDRIQLSGSGVRLMEEILAAAG